MGIVLNVDHSTWSKLIYCIMYYVTCPNFMYHDHISKHNPKLKSQGGGGVAIFLETTCDKKRRSNILIVSKLCKKYIHVI